jgi:hypothetical protein
MKERVLENTLMLATYGEFHFGFIHSIFNDSVNIHWIATKIMPCLLIEEQKENCVSTCQDLQARHERDWNLLQR